MPGASPASIWIYKRLKGLQPPYQLLKEMTQSWWQLPSRTHTPRSSQRNISSPLQT